MTVSKCVLIILLSLCIGFTQSMAISGKVIESGGAGIEGAFVKLEGAGIIDTTDVDGKFTLSNVVSIHDRRHQSVPQNLSAKMRNGILFVEVAQRSELAINTFTLRGKALSSIKKTMNAGVHTIALPQRGTGIYVHKIKSRNREFVLKECSLGGLSNGTFQSTSGASFNTISQMVQAKTLVTDTIRVSKSGYLNSLTSVTTMDTSGMEITLTANDIEFPKDLCFHGSRNEWVYFSGVVETSEGKEFGIMFTIFQRPYSSMFGVCDPVSKIFHDKRLSGQNGTAGKTPSGYPDIDAGVSEFLWDPADNLRMISSANASGVPIFMDINMKPTMDILFHGEDGYIPMGDNIPSGYYSLTNLLPTGGKLSIDNKEHVITGGRMWMDRQWGEWTAAGYAWDWFALRFDDGGALMLFQFRDASQNPTFGNWTYRDKDGLVYYGTDFNVKAHRKFGNFPIDWTIMLPSLNAEFEIDPVFDGQTFTGLWEGLCEVTGNVGDDQLTGQAYAELNRY